MFIMHYSYSFQVYHFEEHHMGYLGLLKDPALQAKRRYCKQKRCKLSEFIIDETLIKVGSDYVWLWVVIEPTNRTILGIRISIERYMLVAEQFIKSV